MHRFLKRVLNFLISHSWIVKSALALGLLTTSVHILHYTNSQHIVPLTETVSTSFNQSLLSSEYFTAENVQSTLLTPYSEQGINVAAGLYYSEQVANDGLKFSDFYAHGTSLAYEYSNSSATIGQGGFYLAAYSILFSDISNEKISVEGFYANFGSAEINLSSEPNQGDLNGSFNYYGLNNSAPLNLMQITSTGTQNFGNMVLNSGIYGPAIVIQTNANDSNPLPIKVINQAGTSFVYIKSKYLFIGDANSISATFTFGGDFKIPTTYLSNAVLSSNFRPSPTFTVTSGSELRAQTSTNTVINTNNQTKIISPDGMDLHVVSVNGIGYYYTMFTLSADNSKVLSGDYSLFNTQTYNIPSSAQRNDDNIVAGTFLGAAVATGLDIIDIKKLRINKI